MIGKPDDTKLVNGAIILKIDDDGVPGIDIPSEFTFYPFKDGDLDRIAKWVEDCKKYKEGRI